ncbi:hypothetical protein GCM10022254_68530 [Actinomadura meridiana]|uniref:Uncharacterized protein n=1 Tax=Actinomadura meridiana TaxID=559626 RepID=A0ABP8CM85_9ACTN
MIELPIAQGTAEAGGYETFHRWGLANVPGRVLLLKTSAFLIVHGSDSLRIDLADDRRASQAQVTLSYEPLTPHEHPTK